MNLLIKIKFKNIFLFFIFTFLSGCTVYDSGLFGTYNPSPKNNYKGIIDLEGFGGPPKSAMQNYCMAFGGLNESSVRKISDPPGAPLISVLHTYWEYQCLGPKASETRSNIVISPAARTSGTNDINSSSLDLNKAREKCFDLGFKEGTEGFGKCVLKLSK